MSQAIHLSSLIFKLLSLCFVMLLVPASFSDAESGKGSIDIDALTLSAETGDPESQFELARLYDEGDGVDENNATAVDWYRKAAEQGYAKAQGYLSEMYFLGEGIKVDDEQAVYWARKAADQGDAFGQNNVGFGYDMGRGLTMDKSKAVDWYRKSAEQGLATGQVNLAMMYDEGEGVAESDEKAVEWFRKAADQGDTKAQISLGFAYQHGEGVAKNSEKAVELYRKAADQGLALAQNNLGWMYDEGEGVAESDEKAVELYRKAADQGLALAQYNLGWMYDEGEGVAESDEKAAEWYKKAADQGYASAQLTLGWMYDNGEGVAENNEKAVEWFRKAAAQGNAAAKYNLANLYEEEVAAGNDTSYFNIGPKALTIISASSEVNSSQELDLGDYHALIIGNSRYEYLDDLSTARKDASDVAEVLKRNYGFSVELLLDATRKDIFTSLNRYRQKLKETDNFLLYYAGHGVLDEIKEGYWQPVDSGIDDETQWISNKRINSTLKKLKANNVLLMADSCFSGAQFRGVTAVDQQSSRPIDSNQSNESLVQRLSKAKTRVAITSGGMEPVLDGIESSENSVFASSFIDALKENKTTFASSDMFTYVRQRVVPITADAGHEQTPEFGKLWASGHQGGDFIFVRADP